MTYRKRRSLVAIAATAGVLLSFARIASAQPSSLDDVVIFAQDSARIFSARLASGDIVVDDPQGFAEIRPLFSVVPDLQPSMVANEVIIPSKRFTGPTLFNLFTNSIDDPFNTLIIDGTLTMPMGFSLPLFPFPSPPVVSPGTTNVQVNRGNSPYSLPPGDYGSVTLAPRSVLYLLGGTYNLRSLAVGPNSQLLANSTATVNVSEKIHISTRGVIGPTDVETLNGRCIVFNTAGTKPMRVGQYSDFTGVLNAPAASVRVARLGTFRGNLTAKNVIIGLSVVLESLPPLSSPCP